MRTISSRFLLLLLFSFNLAKTQTITFAAVNRCGGKSTWSIAVLMCGDSKPRGFEHHVSTLKRQINDLDADVFAVTDLDNKIVLSNKHGGGLSLIEALPNIFGGNLKALGLLGSEQRQIKKACSKIKMEKSCFIVPSPTAPLGEAIGRAMWQWYKLYYAWKFMEDHEANQERHYEIILKLRFDATPLRIQICSDFSDALRNSSFRAIHACTDHIFWGRRDVMEIACTLWPNIFTHFYKLRAFDRPVRVIPLLESLHNLHPNGFSKGKVSSTWQLYPKLGTLPYVDMGSHKYPAASVQRMIENLKKAREADVMLVNPQNKSTLHPTIVQGPLSSPHDMSGSFVTEKDFLGWMINNHGIVICDLGAETTKILYKGRLMQRPSQPCRQNFQESIGHVEH